MQVLEDINNRGTTILMATHAMDIVKAIPRRIIRLDHGHLVTNDDLEDEYEA